jgi:hypothetical protein
MQRTLGLSIAALLLAGSAGSAGAKNAASFSDPAGDAADGAPDVTAIRLSNDDVLQLQFQITLPNRAELGNDDVVFVWIDADGDPSSGVPGHGAEFLVGAFGGLFLTASASRWTGSGFERLSDPVNSTFERSARTLILSVNNRAFDGPRNFVFSIEATIETVHTAKDETGSFSYAVIGDTKAPRVQAAAASGKRGRVVSLRYRVVDENPTSEVIEVFRGTRRIARFGKKLRPFVQRNVVAGWLVPRRLRPGRLRYCVVAEDESRNRSAPACAPLRVR